MSKTIGKKLSDARKAKGWTLQEAADRVDLSPSGVRKMENDEIKSIDPKIIIRCSDVYEDRSILLHYLEEHPVYKAVIPRLFPDLNNIKKDPAIIFSRLADEAEEAAQAARVLSQIFSNADPQATPNFRQVFAAKMEQIVDIQRCAEILMLELIVAGVMTEDDRRDLHERQQAKCEQRGHHRMPAN